VRVSAIAQKPAGRRAAPILFSFSGRGSLSSQRRTSSVFFLSFPSFDLGLGLLSWVLTRVTTCSTSCYQLSITSRLRVRCVRAFCFHGEHRAESLPLTQEVQRGSALWSAFVFVVILSFFCGKLAYEPPVYAAGQR